MMHLKNALLAATLMTLASACVTDDEPPAEETSETASELRACWNAGLYWDPCGAVREAIPQHRQLDYLGGTAFCGGEWWYYMRHHATGHQGWVRTAAVCP